MLCGTPLTTGKNETTDTKKCGDADVNRPDGAGNSGTLVFSEGLVDVGQLEQKESGWWEWDLCPQQSLQDMDSCPSPPPCRFWGRWLTRDLGNVRPKQGATPDSPAGHPPGDSPGEAAAGEMGIDEKAKEPESRDSAGVPGSREMQASQLLVE